MAALYSMGRKHVRGKALCDRCHHFAARIKAFHRALRLDDAAFSAATSSFLDELLAGGARSSTAGTEQCAGAVLVFQSRLAAVLRAPLAPPFGAAFAPSGAASASYITTIKRG